MIKFLNTSGTNYHLEELIKNARDRLVLISPYLKLNDRIKELLEDKDRLKIDIRLVYGKSELSPAEIEWLKSLKFIRTSFCKNLHAKCYLSESEAIVTSLNLYEFSMVNNNEMGVLIRREGGAELYREVYEEAQRLIRISEEVRISLERVEPPPVVSSEASDQSGSNSSFEKESGDSKEAGYLTTAKLAVKLGLETKELTDLLEKSGYLFSKANRLFLTEKGKSVGIWKPGYGSGYFIWLTTFDPRK